MLRSSKQWQKVLGRLFTGGRGDGLNMKHSSQLQVVHTNQWPIPYYRRQTWAPRSLYPETDYNINLSGTEVGEPDHVNVFQAERALQNSVWGREVVAAMHSMSLTGNMNTRISSPAKAAEAYMEDLLKHVNYTRHENARILRKHKLREIFD